MIWEESCSCASARSAVVSHITAEIEAACFDTYALCPSGHEEVAQAIASYLENQKEPYFIESNYLLFLASKALCSIGERMAAARLLAFKSGLVRRADWSFSGGTNLLVLDLRHIGISESDFLELSLFQSLASLLEVMACAWDESAGRGILALRNAGVPNGRIAGRGGKRRGKNVTAGEIKSFCRQTMDGIGRKKGWSDSPLIVEIGG